MRTLVINLASETQRLSFQRAQAERLGLAFDVLPAVCVAQLPSQDKGLDWTRWQRPLRDVEKACLLSHRRAWKRVAALEGPTLILEDDAWLMPSAASFLAQAAQITGIEHLSLETRGRKKMLGATHPQLPSLRRLWLDRTGAAAYILWPEGARKLLERSTKVPALADAVIVETPRLNCWQATPAQAIQIDMAARYDLTPPIPVCSTISNVARPLQAGHRQRFRRYMRQLVMGVGMLRPGTERIELCPQVDF